MTMGLSRRRFAKVAAVASVATLATGCRSNASPAPSPAAQTAAPSTSPDPNARAMHRRAIEAVVWGMPAVNYQLMYEEMARTVNGRFNQVLY
jgi:hypothetical protein